MDKYTLVKVLGKGSFGAAWLIHRKEDKAQLVAKELISSMLQLDPQKRPNVTQIIDLPFMRESLLNLRREVHGAIEKKVSVVPEEERQRMKQEAERRQAEHNQREVERAAKLAERRQAERVQNEQRQKEYEERKRRIEQQQQLQLQQFEEKKKEMEARVREQRRQVEKNSRQRAEEQRRKEDEWDRNMREYRKGAKDGTPPSNDPRSAPRGGGGGGGEMSAAQAYHEMRRQAALNKQRCNQVEMGRQSPPALHCRDQTSAVEPVPADPEPIAPPLTPPDKAARAEAFWEMRRAAEQNKRRLMGLEDEPQAAPAPGPKKPPRGSPSHSPLGLGRGVADGFDQDPDPDGDGDGEEGLHAFLNGEAVAEEMNKEEQRRAADYDALETAINIALDSVGQTAPADFDDATPAALDPMKFILDGKTLKLPNIGPHASLMHRIETLRYFLEGQMGEDRLLSCYKAMNNISEDDDEAMQKVADLLPSAAMQQYIPLIAQLIVCEDVFNTRQGPRDVNGAQASGLSCSVLLMPLLARFSSRLAKTEGSDIPALMVPLPRSRRGGGRTAVVPMLDADSLAADLSMDNSTMDSSNRVVSPTAQPPKSIATSGESAQFEQAFIETKMFISQAPRQVLTMVLHSLLDDYREALLGPISARLEVATNRASLSSPINPASLGTGLGTNLRTPHRISPRPSNTSTPSHRKGGRAHKNKEEEQDMCSVHHSLRAVKHLQVNPNTGNLECIHGFHCLVDTPATSPNNGSALTHTPTPTHGGKRYGEEPSASSPTIIYNIQQIQLQQQQQQLQRQQITEHLKQQQQHLQQFHGFSMAAADTFSTGGVPFAVPAPLKPPASAAAHLDPAAHLVRERERDLSPEDDGMDNKILTDFGHCWRVSRYPHISRHRLGLWLSTVVSRSLAHEVDQSQPRLAPPTRLIATREPISAALQGGERSVEKLTGITRHANEDPFPPPIAGVASSLPTKWDRVFSAWERAAPLEKSSIQLQYPPLLLAQAFSFSLCFSLSCCWLGAFFTPLLSVRGDCHPFANAAELSKRESCFLVFTTETSGGSARMHREHSPYQRKMGFPSTPWSNWCGVQAFSVHRKKENPRIPLHHSSSLFYRVHKSVGNHRDQSAEQQHFHKPLVFPLIHFHKRLRDTALSRSCFKISLPLFYPPPPSCLSQHFPSCMEGTQRETNQSERRDSIRYPTASLEKRHKRNLNFLHGCPSAFSLPSADPAAVMAEAWLRASGVAFQRTPAPHLHLRLLAPQPPGGTSPGRGPQVVTELDNIIRFVSLSVERLRGGANTSTPSSPPPQLQEHQVVARTLAARCLAPAFTFLLYWDPVAYNTARFAIDRRVTTLGEKLLNGPQGYRRNVLWRSPYLGSWSRPAPSQALDTDAAAMAKAVAVMDEVMNACRALDAMCARLAPGTFFGGGPTLSEDDAYVFGAVTCFVHANFQILRDRSPGEQSALEVVQKRIRSACPQLVAYVEKMRVMLWGEERIGKYCLHPLMEEIKEEDAEEAMYARGRTKTLLLTAIFGISYFMVANVGLFIDTETVKSILKKRRFCPASRALGVVSVPRSDAGPFFISQGGPRSREINSYHSADRTAVLQQKVAELSIQRSSNDRRLPLTC
eukprot:gene10100-7067_t